MQKSDNSTQTSSTVLTVLTIFLLVIFPIAGVFIMWVATQWSKTIKWIITVVFFILPLVISIIALAFLYRFYNGTSLSQIGDDTLRAPIAIQNRKSVIIDLGTPVKVQHWELQKILETSKFDIPAISQMSIWSQYKPRL